MRMKSIAIITARSGSKGLPDKNIKKLAGKPLMAWSIEAALKSGMFDTVMVSTDSEKYAAIAREYGAEVPFLRSAAMSSDTASSWDTVAEVLEEYRKLGREYDAFMLLQPTSPFRTAQNIIDAFAEMEKRGAEAIVSFCEPDEPPQRCMQLPEDFALNHIGEYLIKNARRQQLGTWYRCNGAMYLVKTDFFRADHTIYRDGCYAIIMNKRDSIDIDDEFDFNLAEALLILMGKGSAGGGEG